MEKHRPARALTCGFDKHTENCPSGKIHIHRRASSRFFFEALAKPIYLPSGIVRLVEICGDENKHGTTSGNHVEGEAMMELRNGC
jgi:hypothetical protein